MVGYTGTSLNNPEQTGFEPIAWDGRSQPGKALERADMTKPWLSADDIALHLGVSKDTVYTWIADKGMPAHKIGRLWKVHTSEVDDWVRSVGTATGAVSTSTA